MVVAWAASTVVPTVAVVKVARMEGATEGTLVASTVGMGVMGAQMAGAEEVMVAVAAEERGLLVAG